MGVQYEFETINLYFQMFSAKTIIFLFTKSMYINVPSTMVPLALSP
jgi:hypothetical protein